MSPISEAYRTWMKAKERMKRMFKRVEEWEKTPKI